MRIENSSEIAQIRVELNKCGKTLSKLEKLLGDHKKSTQVITLQKMRGYYEFRIEVIRLIEKHQDKLGKILSIIIG